MGEIGDARAIEPLFDVLRAGEPWGWSAEWALIKIGAPAVNRLMRALADPDDGVGLLSAGALQRIGSPAIDPLIAALQDKRAIVRLRAAWALKSENNPNVANALIAGWRASDLAVIAGAYIFFIQQGEQGSEGILISALNAYGNRDMAQVFLTSKNSTLEAEARAWARIHGYRIEWDINVPQPNVIWGEHR